MGKIHLLTAMIFLAGTWLGACQAQKPAAERFVHQQISFGSGGGFTGMVTTYTLQQNGEIHSANSLSKESKLLKKLSRPETSELFKQAEALNLESIDFKHPGNRYYFIEVSKEAAAHNITWGSEEHKAPQAVVAFYELLESKISDQ